MNKIKSLNVNYLKSEDLKDSYEIFKLSFKDKDNDLYFIDKGFANFHISIHKDASVWLTHQNIWEKRPKIKLFQFDWSMLDIEPEKEKPFIFYLPVDFINYPQVKTPNKRNSHLFLTHVNLKNQLLKIFLINYNTLQPLIREDDSGFLSKSFDSIDNIDLKNNKREELKDSFVMFDKHQFRFSCSKIDKSPILDKFRVLFICQPSSEFGLSEFIKNYKFKINTDVINSDGYQIDIIKINGYIDLCIIIY